MAKAEQHREKEPECHNHHGNYPEEGVVEAEATVVLLTPSKSRVST
jgi:hypothetical protein